MVVQINIKVHYATDRKNVIYLKKVAILSVPPDVRSMVLFYVNTSNKEKSEYSQQRLEFYKVLRIVLKITHFVLNSFLLYSCPIGKAFRTHDSLPPVFAPCYVAADYGPRPCCLLS